METWTWGIWWVAEIWGTTAQVVGSNPKHSLWAPAHIYATLWLRIVHFAVLADMLDLPRLVILLPDLMTVVWKGFWSRNLFDNLWCADGRVTTHQLQVERQWPAATEVAQVVKWWLFRLKQHSLCFPREKHATTQRIVTPGTKFWLYRLCSWL